MERKKKILNLKTGIISMMVTGLVAAILIVAFSITPVVVEETYIKSWHTITLVVSEGDPGSGQGGLLEFFYINHTATPATTYVNNSSATLESWCNASGGGYASADDFRFESDHTTTYDMLVRVRGNKTQCWNGTVFIDARLRVNMTSANFGIPALTAMTGVITYNNSGQQYLWMNFYLDNGGAGYSITPGNESRLPTIRYQAYY